MTRTRFSYKRAINWNTIIINVKEYEIHKLNREFKPITTGDWIKYHRMKNDWSQMTLAKKLGLNKKQCRYLIKDYEARGVYPPKELSIKLAEIFELESTYFYDDYYENLDKLPLLLKEYRESNKLTKTACANLVGTSYSMWSRWENGTSPSRSYFKKLMKLHIIS